MRNPWDRLSTHTTAFMIYGLGLFMLVSGIDKFISPLVWGSYTPTWVRVVIPFTTTTFMHIVGVMEFLIGLLIMSRRKTYVWAGLLSLWLLSITFAVASLGVYDIAFRDIGLAFFAFTVSLEAYRATTQ